LRSPGFLRWANTSELFSRILLQELADSLLQAPRELLPHNVARDRVAAGARVAAGVAVEALRHWATVRGILVRVQTAFMSRS
jgi:hypothetical protein